MMDYDYIVSEILNSSVEAETGNESAHCCEIEDQTILTRSFERIRCAQR